jgi:hypothetical protein
MAVSVAPQAPRPDVRVIKRSLTLGALVFIMFFTVSGGAYGLEDTPPRSSCSMPTSRTIP